MAKSKLRESTEAIVWAVLVALSVRAFLIEPYKIPSGSMIPTLSVGDHIFVNKFIYGIRIPFTTKRLIHIREPRRGEVVVFKAPLDGGPNYIKRIIGLPGDRIHIEGETLTINGELLSSKELTVNVDPDDRRRLLVSNGFTSTIPFVPGWGDFHFVEEKVGERAHLAQYERDINREAYDAVVPPQQLFVMGDNRDHSHDSRAWGFLPSENVKGKAMFVWLSLDGDQGGIRWHEFGRWIE